MTDPNLPPVVVPDPPTNTLIPSLIRTWVPIAIGVLATWVAAHFGIIVPESFRVELGALVAGLLVTLYYTIIRVIETKFPQIGVLFGLARQPVYAAEHHRAA